MRHLRALVALQRGARGVSAAATARYATSTRLSPAARRCVLGPRRAGPWPVRQLATDSDVGGHAIARAVALLRDPEAVRGAREPILSAIQSIAIPGPTTELREQQALRLIQADALEPLLGFLRDDRLVDLHVPTYLCLIRLSSEPLVAHELLRLDAPAILATHVGHPDPRLQAAACVTLGNLALDPAAAAPLATSSVVDALLAALESPHEAIQRSALTTLASIAGSQRGRQQLRELESLLAISAKLSADYSEPLRMAAASALGNVLLDHDAAAQDALRESGALAELVLLASPVYSPDVCSAAAWAIHHGAHLNRESQTMVVDAGGLGLLFQHAFSDDESLQTNALLALDSLTVGHDDNTAICRNNADAVELLAALQRDAADDLNASAKLALHSLLTRLR
ncbi:hypothetical protein P43SY_005350 [Pythium insidiosum]|uniref:Vacuolar protein 8 n=1 Tax=Pythium insidiosum TaxID=114742 RepID=A0AAD5QDP9_PYTIN|nr:hypothetical protein P43SY_005350 [Pythium insidiosum]